MWDFASFISRQLLLPLVLAILANALADMFLRRIQFEFGYPAHLYLRRLRWVSVSVALLVLAIVRVAPIPLITFALFSVTAATDLESTFLPPDAFTLGSTAICLMLSFVQSGWPNFRDAVVAETTCFAVMVFVVAFSSACDSGDIKLVMQFGAAAGSLANIFVGVMGMWLVMMCLLIAHMIQHRSITSISQVRLPLGPIAWVGLVIALLWRAQ